MILEIGIGALALGAFIAQRKRDAAKNVAPHIQAQRDVIFETAMSLRDAKKLRELSSSFKSQGLVIQAELLEKRAQLNEAPPDVKAQRREVFRKAMESRDKAAVLATAEAFESAGATGAAENLRLYASGLAVDGSGSAEMGTEG